MRSINLAYLIFKAAKMIFCKGKSYMKVYSISVKGLRKEKNKNEDSFLILEKSHSSSDEKDYLLAVCDGLGGMKAGEIASSLCCQSLERFYNISDEFSDRTFFLKSMIRNANNEVYQVQLIKKEYKGMATTLTILLLNNKNAYYASIGDSRLYLLRNGKLTQLTEDETVVWKQYRQNNLSKDELVNHPQSHLLTNALGSHQFVRTNSIKSISVKKEDVFLLSSDGLHDYLTDEIIQNIMTESSSFELKLSKLIDAARNEESIDDITILIFYVD